MKAVDHMVHSLLFADLKVNVVIVATETSQIEKGLARIRTRSHRDAVLGLRRLKR